MLFENFLFSKIVRLCTFKIEFTLLILLESNRVNLPNVLKMRSIRSPHFCHICRVSTIRFSYSLKFRRFVTFFIFSYRFRHTVTRAVDLRYIRRPKAIFNVTRYDSSTIQWWVACGHVIFHHGIKYWNYTVEYHHEHGENMIFEMSITISS